MKNLAKAFGILLLSVWFALGQTGSTDAWGVKLGESRPLSFSMVSGKSAPTWDSLKGKVVVIDFWATWCEPCVSAIPAMNELHKTFGDRARFISVTYEPTDYVAGFLRTHPIDGDVAIDDDLATFKGFKAWGRPAVFIFDKTGTLVAIVHPTKLTPAVLASAINGDKPAVEQENPWKDPDGAEKYFRENQTELRKKYPKAGS